MTITLPSHLASLLQQAGGHWPEADEGRLTTMAADWRGLAAALDTVRTDGNRMAATVTSENRGASVDAFSQYWSANLGTHLASASTGATQSAVAVESMAKASLSAKSAIVKALGTAQEAIAKAERTQNAAIIGPLIGFFVRNVIGPILRLLAKVLWEIIKFPGKLV